MRDSARGDMPESVGNESPNKHGYRISEVIKELFVNLDFMLRYRVYESAVRPAGTKTGKEFADYAKYGLLIGEIGYIIGSHTRVNLAHKFWLEFLRKSLTQGGVMNHEFIAYASKLKNKSQILTNHCNRLSRIGVLDVQKKGIYKTRYRPGPYIYYSPEVLKKLRKALKSARAANCWSNGRITLISSGGLDKQGFSKNLVESMMNDMNAVARDIYLKYSKEWYSANVRIPVDIEGVLADAEKKFGTFDGEGYEQWLMTQEDSLPRFPLIVVDPNPSALKLRRMNGSQFAKKKSHPKKTRHAGLC